MSKVVILKFGNGNLETGFPVVLQIGEVGCFIHTEVIGFLPANVKLQDSYNKWQEFYRKFNSKFRKISVKQVAFISLNFVLDELIHAAGEVIRYMAEWLESETFKTISYALFENFQSSDKIRLIIQSENSLITRLPWHKWNFLEKYPNAEFVLSSLQYSISQQNPRLKHKNKVKVLVILGNSQGMDVSQDKKFLKELPGANLTFLVEPNIQEINDKLWEDYWDILFFAGHSQTEGEHGRIYINPTDSLTIQELRYGLKKAIANGLQLAIFNSCDGLGLAWDLADLQIPQTIVMREPVPDRVAQTFLKYFLAAFSRGESFYLSVREARERLQGLEREFPCATWLPVICQNPATIPLTWKELQGTSSQTNDLVVKSFKHLFGIKIRVATFFLLLGIIGIGLALPQISMNFSLRGIENQLLGQFNRAQFYFNLAVKINPSSGVNHYNLANICEKTEDFDCARTHYQISAMKGFLPAYNNLARLEIMQQDYLAATDLIRTGLKLEGNDNIKSALHKNLGWVMLKQNRYDEAEIHLQEAIKLQPNRSTSYCLLAQVQEAKGDAQNALSQWDNCLRYAINHSPEADAWVALARYRLENGIQEQ